MSFHAPLPRTTLPSQVSGLGGSAVRSDMFATPRQTLLSPRFPEVTHTSRSSLPSTGVESYIASLLSEHEKRIVSHLEQHGRTLVQIKKQLDQQQLSSSGSEADAAPLPLHIESHIGAVVQSTIAALAKLPVQRQAVQQPLQQDLLWQQERKQVSFVRQPQSAEQPRVSASIEEQRPLAADGPGESRENNLSTPLLPKTSPDESDADAEAEDDGDEEGAELQRRNSIMSFVIPKPLQWLGKKTSSTRMKSLFPSVDDIRDMVAETLRDHNYDVEDFYYKEGTWQWLARNERFKNFILATVITNVFWIGIETDYNKAPVLCEAGAVFQIMDNTYCFIFLVDITIRFFAFEGKKNACLDPWFAFDSVLVAFMALETWVLVAFYLVFGYSGGGKFAQHFQLLRMVRLVRLLKVARSARLLQSVPELAVLGQGMIRGVRSLLAVFAMLMLIVYAFGVAFCVMLADTEVGSDVFEDVPQAMNSLLLIVLCGPDADFIRKLLAENWACYLIYLGFLLIAMLILLNMMTAMLCDVVAKSSEGSREAALMSRMQASLSSVASELDGDGDGRIDRDEFEIIIKDPTMTASLTELDVDIVGVANFAKFIYDQTDSISYDDFALLAGRFRTEKLATGKDMMDMRHYVTMELLELASTLKEESAKAIDALSERSRAIEENHSQLTQNIVAIEDNAAAIKALNFVAQED